MTTQSETMRNHWWWPGWRVGRRFYTLHLTFEGQDDVHRLAAEYRFALAPLGDILTPIPDQWLHLTMQGIGFIGETKEQDVNSIVEEAHTRLAGVPAFDLRIGPEVLDSEAVLHVHPDSPVRAVRSAIREAIGDVLGDVPEKAEGFPLTSLRPTAPETPPPAQPMAQIRDDLNLTPAQARISSAELIVIHRDNQLHEWEPFAKVPLG